MMVGENRCRIQDICIGFYFEGMYTWVGSGSDPDRKVCMSLDEFWICTMGNTGSGSTMRMELGYVFVAVPH